MHVCNIVIIIIVIQARGRGSLRRARSDQSSVVPYQKLEGLLRSPPAAPDLVIQHITICIHVMEGSVVNSPVKGQNMKRL